MHNHQTEYDLDARICRQFGLGHLPPGAYSPLALAYIGDGIYELVIRSVVVAQGNRQVKKLHQQTSRYVKAQAQSRMMETLLPLLTQEEEEIYRRGRNAKSYSVAKNASVHDYRRATGMEALLGYLYLNGELDRLLTLVQTAVDNYVPDERTGAETRNQENFYGEKRVSKGTGCRGIIAENRRKECSSGSVPQREDD